MSSLAKIEACDPMVRGREEKRLGGHGLGPCCSEGGDESWIAEGGVDDVYGWRIGIAIEASLLIVLPWRLLDGTDSITSRVQGR